MNLKAYPRGSLIAVDTETTGLDPYGPHPSWPVGTQPARAHTWSFCDTVGHVEVVDFPVDPVSRSVLYDENVEGFDYVASVMSNTSMSKVFFNASFDVRMSTFAGMDVGGQLHDLAFLAHVATGGALSGKTLALKRISEKYLGIPDDDQKKLIDSIREARRMGPMQGWALTPRPKNAQSDGYLMADCHLGDRALKNEYAGNDAQRTMLGWQYFIKYYEKEPRLRDVYRREMRVFPVVVDMEQSGVRVIPDSPAGARDFYESELTRHRAESMRLGAPDDLNVDSTPQLIDLFESRGVAVPTKKNDKGKTVKTVDGDSLVKIAAKDALAREVIEIRACMKSISPFVEALEAAPDGVLHPNYRQVGTRTGRFSCANPNLQNLPGEKQGQRKAETESRIRECLGPRPGHVWYLADYSQLQVWVFAFLAQEPDMMDALLSGLDFHQFVAGEVWGWLPDYDERKDHYRKKAKNAWFADLFGVGMEKLSSMWECSEHEARMTRDRIACRFPGKQRYMDKMSAEGASKGMVTNIFGRKFAVNRTKGYTATNYVVQGTEADIMKNAMVNVNGLLRDHWQDVKIVMQIHDELVLEVPLRLHSKRLMREVVNEMQYDSLKLGLPWGTPLPVNVKVAKERWNEKVEVKL